MKTAVFTVGLFAVYAAAAFGICLGGIVLHRLAFVAFDRTLDWCGWSFERDVVFGWALVVTIAPFALLLFTGFCVAMQDPPKKDQQ